jgi:hypothetical protein
MTLIRLDGPAVCASALTLLSTHSAARSGDSLRFRAVQGFAYALTMPVRAFVTVNEPSSRAATFIQ